MAGAELIGKEEIKEVMDVLRTGVFARPETDRSPIALEAPNPAILGTHIFAGVL